MRMLIALVVVCHALGMAQSSTGAAKTTGPCSPAISGSHNTLTLDCYGPKASSNLAIDLVYDPTKQSLSFINRGSKSISLWGNKFGDISKTLHEPIVLAGNGGIHSAALSPMLAEMGPVIVPNGEIHIPMDVYVSTEDKTRHIINYLLWIRARDSLISIETQNLGTKDADFTSPQTEADAPISFRLTCDMVGLPLHIAPASTIHVIRVHPAVLQSNPKFPDLGVFEDISSPPDTTLEWPSEKTANGRWMTKEEFEKSWQSTNFMPSVFSYKCSLTSYSSSTLDDIIAFLIVETAPMKAGYSYPIAFDPLMAGHSFQFYVINICSSGGIPMMIHWNDLAKVRILGEQEMRLVPFRYEKRSIMNQIMFNMGPSRFLWNGMQDCQWDRK